MSIQTNLFEVCDEEEIMSEGRRIVQETSREAYKDLRSHPLEIHGRHSEYLNALNEMGQPSTDMEVAKFLNKTDPNYVRPRRNELAETDKEKRLFNKPLVQYTGNKRKCKVTGKTCMTWWFTDLGKTLFDMEVF